MLKQISPTEWIEILPSGRKRIIAVPNGADQSAAADVADAVDPGPGVEEVARMICYREIDAVVPPYKRESLAHHRESLIPGDLLTYQAGLDWIGAMRARIYEMEGLGLDPWDAASWPAVPADLPDLVSRY